MSQALVQILDYQERNFSKIQDRPLQKPAALRFLFSLFTLFPFYLFILHGISCKEKARFLACYRIDFILLDNR